MRKTVLILVCDLLLLSCGFAQWQPTCGEIGGYTTVLTVDPATNYLYAGTGGVFFSNNNGSSWTAKNTGLLNILPSEEFKAVAASGNNLFAEEVMNGVYLSIDDGNSWTEKNNGLSILGKMVLSIAIDGNNIYLGSMGDGIYLSTDNGDNWTQKNNGLLKYCVASIAIKGDSVFAGTCDGGTYLSTNDGSSWTPVNSGLSGQGLNVTSLAVSRDNIFAGTKGGIYLLTKTGTSWTAINNGLPVSDLYVNSITTTNGKIFASTSGGGVFLSVDNGSNWIGVDNGLSGNKILTLAVCGSYVFGGASSSGVWRRLISEMIFMNVSTKNLSIEAAENSTATFNITSLNTSWSISCSDPWLAISNSSGSGDATITLTAQQNTTGSPRSTALKVSGSGVEAQTITVVQAGLTGDFNITEDKSIIVYPNPVKNTLFISGVMPDVKISIINSQGITVLSNSLNKNQIDVSGLTKGTYTIKIENNTNVVLKRFVKQ